MIRAANIPSRRDFMTPFGYGRGRAVPSRA